MQQQPMAQQPMVQQPRQVEPMQLQLAHAQTMPLPPSKHPLVSLNCFHC
jgi:hypothetical protein